MATINTDLPSYVDMAKRMDPDGTIADIAEMLAEENPIVQDGLVVEGNLETGHRHTVRAGLPSATWRRLNYGVPRGKSRTVQVDDSVGMLEAYGEVDKDLVELNGNKAAFRMSEDSAYIESMNQEMAETTFYGDEAQYPDRFTGLAPRYSDLSAPSGANVIDAGGSGSDNTSVWFVTWHPRTTFFIYPKGSKVGLQMRDLGEHTLMDENGNQFQGYRSHYQWKLGMTVRDWRYNVRIANIDVSDLQAGTYTSLIDDMIKAYWRVRTQGLGRQVIYCNRTLATYLDILATNKANVWLSQSEFAGKKVTTFRGWPIRICEAILNTEAEVT